MIIGTVTTSDRVDSSRPRRISFQRLVLGGKQERRSWRGKAHYERLTCEWALYMKQIEQSEQHGCLRGDATEREQEYRFGTGGRRAPQASVHGDNGDTRCRRTNHSKQAATAFGM